ncbi:MAG TPA: glycosyltransferase, partial [Candidatus Tumulicola sp.]|nr:glycosyltransferase [Candidatus Tumulicola sp.]
YGPHETFFASEVRELAALHHDVTVIPTRPVRGPIPYRGFAAGVLRLPLFGLQTIALALAAFARQPLPTLRLLAGLLRARHGAGAKLKNLAVFPKALAVAWEVRRRKVEHVHALWLSTPATIAYVVSELTGIPWSASAHRFDVFTDNLLRDKLESASFVRAISENTRRLLLERAGGDLSDRCKVVHLGVDVPAALAMRRKDRTVRLLCPAQLVPKKGHAYLLDALALLRDNRIPFACDLAGDGPLGVDLQRKIDQLGLTASVSMCGNMPHDILLSRLERSFYDVVVLASVDIDGQPGEGIPVSLMEAMAVGIPCVATRTGGVPELIDDPRCSRVVPQRDPAALAAAIVEFALDPARRAAIGERARKRICAAFDVKTTTMELCEMMATR